MPGRGTPPDRKSTRLNSSHSQISYAVFCLKKKKKRRGVAGARFSGRCPKSADRAPPRRARAVAVSPAPSAPGTPEAAGLCGSFFFNDTATTEIYTLSLHDALPISHGALQQDGEVPAPGEQRTHLGVIRSEEHTSELQSQSNLVCRLLLEKKNR